MSAYEERKELLAAAAKLEVELKRLRLPIMAVVSALLSEADRLKLAAADEITSGDVKVTKVSYGKTAGPPSEGFLGSNPVGFSGAPIPLAPGKRACSICRRPGHRAANCPEANTKYKADRAVPTAQPIKNKKGRKK